MCLILDPTTCGLSCAPRSYSSRWPNLHLSTQYGDTGECMMYICVLTASAEHRLFFRGEANAFKQIQGLDVG